MDLINPLLNVVTSLHGEALVIFTLIVLGYVMKTAFFFPNEWIPRVNFFIAPILTILIVQWPDPADTWMQKLKYPEPAAWANTLMKGTGLFFIAWVIHHKALKTLIDDKVPAMNPGMKRDTTTTETVQVTGGEETKVTEKTDRIELPTEVAKPPENEVGSGQEDKV